MRERLGRLAKPLPKAVAIGVLVLCLATTTLASEGQARPAGGDSFVESLYSALESMAVTTLHPAYLKIRADPMLSNVFFVVLVLFLVNALVFNIFGLLTCGLCKVGSLHGRRKQTPLAKKSRPS